MQIGVISNRPQIRHQFSRVINEFVETSCLDIETTCFESQSELLRAVSTRPLDMLFYDTEQSEHMEDKLWEIMHTIPACALVLTGDDTRYAVFGYAVRALDYLTTPVDDGDLLDCLSRILRRRIEAKNQFLPVKVCGVWAPVSTEKMVYLESMAHNLVLHMNDGAALKILASFRDYDSMLNLNRHFFRCHKSYVVNMRYVSALESGQFLLTNGESVNISRTYSQAARSFYASYIAENYTRELLSPVEAKPAEMPTPTQVLDVHSPALGHR